VGLWGKQVHQVKQEREIVPEIELLTQLPMAQEFKTVLDYREEGAPFALQPEFLIAWDRPKGNTKESTVKRANGKGD
jgi:hypothetical protein